MSTQAQQTANQANAQHSTGPRTVEGKSKTRRNASRHGLCSTTALMSGENQEQFELLYAALYAEHRPASPTESILVHKMAVNFFAFTRAETLLAEQLDFNDDEDNTKQVALMLRYQTTADRAFNRNLADLRKLQKERRNGAPEIPFDINAQMPWEPPVDEPIGSVPQNLESPRPQPSAVDLKTPARDIPAPQAGSDPGKKAA